MHGFDSEEQENRDLGGTIRQDQWSRLRFKDQWHCSDYQRFDNWNQALEHEKSINVLARHRGAVPERVRVYITTDGREFPIRSASQYGRIREIQSAIDHKESCDEFAKKLWKRGQKPIETKEDLAEFLEANYEDFQKKFVFMPMMMM